MSTVHCIEITDHLDNPEVIIADRIESFAPDTLPTPNGSVPCVRVWLLSGRVLVAKYDTKESFRERLAASRGGVSLMIHALPIHKRPEPTPATQATSEPVQEPAAPLTNPPNGQIIVPGENAPLDGPAKAAWDEVSARLVEEKKADMHAAVGAAMGNAPAPKPGRPKK